MFTRTELEIKTVPELRSLCQRYGLKPTGNSGYKDSYIVSLMAFPALALDQFEMGRGLKPPSLRSVQVIATALDEIGSPTDEQIALIRISMEGRRMAIPDRFDQEKLLMLFKAKGLLEELLGILVQ